MNSRLVITNIKYIAIITVSMFVIWSVTLGLLMGIIGFVDTTSADPMDAAVSTISLVVVSFLTTVVISWFLNRTQFLGLRLGALVFLMTFGVMFFMTQMETVIFNSAIEMPWQVIMATMVSGLAVSVTVAALSVLYRRKIGGQSNVVPKLDNAKLLQKFLVLGVVYMILYFLFGYFVAWQVSDLREFYSGSTDILPFVAHMQNVIQTDVWLPIIQIARGMLWAGIGYLALAGLGHAKSWERYVIVGLVLSVSLSTQLLIPNSFMPDIVRLGHFFEVLLENFIFGAVVVLLFKPRKPLDHGSTYST